MERRTPVISIIVPVYNVEKHLPTCIRSILNQTFRDLELILVDDGSPDRCPELCDAAAREDDRVVVIHQKNGGLSAARNAGLEIARGQYIGFVDSDDSIAPEMYETLLERMQKDGSQIAVCDYQRVTEDGTPWNDRPVFARDEVLSGAEAVDRIRKGHFTVAWNRLYERKIFETLRFPVGRLHEDEYIAHLVYWQCRRVSVVAEPLYYYVQRAGSIARSVTFRHQIDQAEGILRRAEFSAEHQLDAAAVDACMCAMNLLAQILPAELPPEQKEQLREEERRTNALADRLRKIPGFRKDKLRMRLFRLSPGLYKTLLLERNRPRKAENEKND